MVKKKETFSIPIKGENEDEGEVEGEVEEEAEGEISFVYKRAGKPKEYNYRSNFVKNMDETIKRYERVLCVTIPICIYTLWYVNTHYWKLTRWYKSLLFFGFSSVISNLTSKA